MSSIPVTIADIRTKEVCLDPANWIPEGWSGTLLDLYNLENLEPENKVLMGCFFLSEAELLTFITWCFTTSGDATIEKYLTTKPPHIAAWRCSKELAASGNLTLDAQVTYLKGVETARGA